MICIWHFRLDSSFRLVRRRWRERKPRHKIAARTAGISRDFYFLVGFFRVTHDGLSERGTTDVNCNSCERIKKKRKEKERGTTRRPIQIQSDLLCSLSRIARRCSIISLLVGFQKNTLFTYTTGTQKHRPSVYFFFIFFQENLHSELEYRYNPRGGLGARSAEGSRGPTRIEPAPYSDTPPGLVFPVDCRMALVIPTCYAQ